MQDKKDRARLVAACGVQKAYRGFRDRQRVRLILWQRYEKAAAVIQARYRRWRDEKKVDERILKALPKGQTIFRACRKAAPLRQRQKLKFDTDNQEPTSILFRRCLRGNASHRDKMTIWRAIVELRRGHPYWSTHVAFKAMIESRGNLDRSLTLMSDETYALKNEHDVPMQLQKLFIPTLPADSSAASAGAGATTAGTVAGPETNRSSSPINFATTSASMSASLAQALGGGATGISGIRNVRQSRAAAGNALDYSSLFVRNYFSKHYAGCTHLQNPCRKPNGFEPHQLGPLSPRSDGTVLQSTDKTLRHGMKPEAFGTKGGALVPALQLSATGSFGANSSLAGQQQLRSPVMYPSGVSGHTISASGVGGGGAGSREPTPRERFAKGTTPSRDTELLAGLLQLQQQMDALGAR